MLLADNQCFLYVGGEFGIVFAWSNFTPLLSVMQFNSCEVELLSIVQLAAVINDVHACDSFL